jgi:hypothetical protein
MNKYILSAMLMLGVLISGCNAKDVVKSLVEKAYKVAVNVENVVTKSSTEEFVITVKMLDTPLRLLKSTLGYVETKIKDQKVKDAIAKGIVAIDKITVAVSSITPQKVNEAKVTVLSSLEDVKLALKFIGEYVGAQFPTVSVAANTDVKKELTISCNDLSKLLDEAK